MKNIESLTTETITGATNALFDKSEHRNDQKTDLLTGASLSANGEIIAEQLGNVIVKEGKNIQRYLLQQGIGVQLMKAS
ncbi:hypothetical protein QWY77_11775 [Thalassotalea ponticola]|uniref:hypothetical protein n=1 Tax=Thalassotalea ponticola TaxID=1523392 RepID=UPI0025B323D0|nr:hypothetical protein [Thalassotalea ponticola]MDN3653421.1 hypothetical protein [Thalassotalea ponticola]